MKIGKNIIKGSFFNRFRKFLIEKDLIYFMIAVYTGTVLQRFLESFTKSILIPIFNLITPKWLSEREGMFNEYLESLGFVNIEEFLQNTFNLLIAIIVSYYLIRFVLKIN